MLIKCLPVAVRLKPFLAVMCGTFGSRLARNHLINLPYILTPCVLGFNLSIQVQSIYVYGMQTQLHKRTNRHKAHFTHTHTVRIKSVNVKAVVLEILPRDRDGERKGEKGKENVVVG